MPPSSRASGTPPLSTPVNNLIYDNAAVGHQLGVDRNDMLAPGKEKKRFFFCLVLNGQPFCFFIDVSRVLVIYTGGTIGMKHTVEHGYIPVS
jgi:lysophospholipase